MASKHLGELEAVVRGLEDEDAVVVQTTGRRTLPMTVVDAGEPEGWHVPSGAGADWPGLRRTVVLETAQETRYVLVVDTLSHPLQATLASSSGGDVRERGEAVRAVEVVPDTDEWWCACGHGPSSLRGIRIHHGKASDDQHDGDPVVHPFEPDQPDSAATAVEDDGPEAREFDPDIGLPDWLVPRQHSNRLDDLDDRLDVPVWLTAGDVAAAVEDAETLDDVANQLDVRRGLTRAIVFGLGLYGDLPCPEARRTSR